MDVHKESNESSHSHIYAEDVCLLDTDMSIALLAVIMGDASLWAREV